MKKLLCILECLWFTSFSSVLIFAILTVPTLAAERTGYLVATKELTEIRWIGPPYGPSTFEIRGINLSSLSIRPDYVVAEADVQINTPNSCVGLEISIKNNWQPLTGTADPNDNESIADCFEGNIQKGKRSYTTTSITQNLDSSDVSLDVYLRNYFGGSNASSSQIYVRKLRLYLFSYTPPDAANLPLVIDQSSFSGLVAHSTIGQLFGNQYYINIDNERYRFSAASNGSSALQSLPNPLKARQVSFYLPENSVYQSSLRYQQPNAEQKLVIYGTQYNGANVTPAAYGNPSSLRSFDLLQRVNYFSAYLIPYPKPTAMAVKPQATSVTNGNSIAVDISLSGIHPGTLKYKVGSATEVSPVVSGNQLWNALLYQGKTTLSIPVTGTVGKSVPILLRANAIDSNQELSYSFVVTIR